MLQSSSQPEKKFFSPEPVQPEVLGGQGAPALEKEEKEGQPAKIEVMPKEPFKEAPLSTLAASVVKTAPVAPVKDKLLEEVENILEEDLKEIYFDLPPETQKKFHDKGEETAGKIRILLTQAKVQVSKILKLIREWLKIIPGVNRFFLEQEAKIKIDRLMFLANQQKEKEK